MKAKQAESKLLYGERKRNKEEEKEADKAEALPNQRETRSQAEEGRETGGRLASPPNLAGHLSTNAFVL